jgi:hypothetical protein
MGAQVRCCRAGKGSPPAISHALESEQLGGGAASQQVRAHGHPHSEAADGHALLRRRRHILAPPSATS